MGDADALERLERESGVLQKRAEEQRKQLSHIGGGGAKTLDQLSDEVLAAEEHLEEEERKRDTYATKQQRATAEVALVRMPCLHCRERMQLAPSSPPRASAHSPRSRAAFAIGVCVHSWSATSRRRARR